MNNLEKESASFIKSEGISHSGADGVTLGFIGQEGRRLFMQRNNPKKPIFVEESQTLNINESRVVDIAPFSDFYLADGAAQIPQD